MALQPGLDLVSRPLGFWKDEGLNLCSDAAFAAAELALGAAYYRLDRREGWSSSSSSKISAAPWKTASSWGERVL